MKRFLIFRLAAFQWAGALRGAPALIPAPGSIISVSGGSPRPRKPAEEGVGVGVGKVFFSSFMMPVWLKGEIAGYSP